MRKNETRHRRKSSGGQLKPMRVTLQRESSKALRAAAKVYGQTLRGQIENWIALAQAVEAIFGVAGKPIGSTEVLRRISSEAKRHRRASKIERNALGYGAGPKDYVVIVRYSPGGQEIRGQLGDKGNFFPVESRHPNERT